MYTYLLLNIFTISIPLAYSFEKKIAYYKNWKYLFSAIVITGAFFLIWDSLFTRMQVWRFNPEYLVGVYLFNLPIEEWLFFLTVPFSCVFIYESLKYFVKKDILKPYASYITAALAVALIITAALHHQRAYTFTNFMLTAGFLIFHWIAFGKRFLGIFYLTYLIHLIPFFIVNGILTYLPVVEYNDNENLGVRMGSIPVEDAVYSMFLLLMNITIFEYLKNKKWQNIKE